MNVFRAVEDENGVLRAPDGRQCYDFACPYCGHEAVACRSLFMEMGINRGGGQCPKCHQYFRLEMVPDLDGNEMKALERTIPESNASFK